MAREFASKGVEFVFLYTREAHPGENYPAHSSFKQKLDHARAFKAEFNIERPILVDDLAGSAHKLYGSLPNMTYLISRGECFSALTGPIRRQSSTPLIMCSIQGRGAATDSGWRRSTPNSSAIVGMIRRNSKKDWFVPDNKRSMIFHALWKNVRNNHCGRTN
jgi:hypothetical protein